MRFSHGRTTRYVSCLAIFLPLFSQIMHTHARVNMHVRRIADSFVRMSHDRVSARIVRPDTSGQSRCHRYMWVTSMNASPFPWLGILEFFVSPRPIVANPAKLLGSERQRRRQQAVFTEAQLFFFFFFLLLREIISRKIKVSRLVHA